ncbi:hypothetical protein HQN90_01315 [Paenibacillus alba]|nr:hypothetical protein [Paenibacillus alba]
MKPIIPPLVVVSFIIETIAPLKRMIIKGVDENDFHLFSLHNFCGVEHLLPYFWLAFEIWLDG